MFTIHNKIGYIDIEYMKMIDICIYIFSRTHFSEILLLFKGISLTVLSESLLFYHLFWHIERVFFIYIKSKVVVIKYCGNFVYFRFSRVSEGVGYIIMWKDDRWILFLFWVLAFVKFIFNNNNYFSISTFNNQHSFS